MSFLTVTVGLVLLALGAFAGVLSAQATKLTGMLLALGFAFLGENKMPDAWWTPDAVKAFGITAGSIATTVGVIIDYASFFTKLPGKIGASLISRSTGALFAGRSLGPALGFLSGEGIARQINYYTSLEVNCLTQSSCVTN